MNRPVGTGGGRTFSAEKISITAIVTCADVEVDPDPTPTYPLLESTVRLLNAK
jgi:hypothetical protein